MKKLFLFDVDGTLVESSKKINDHHADILNELKKKHDIGILGGGELSKILEQMDDKVYFNHYFTECGSVYHINEENGNLKLIYKKDILFINFCYKITIKTIYIFIFPNPKYIFTNFFSKRR